MNWWREARFGLFIHWGLYAIPAGEAGDETHHGEWIMHTAQIPVERYENLASRFNPVKFNADQWARLAKEAGMKYIVITSKHHDGFCLFDSAQTDYDIMSTPFARDIMRELADACRRHGLKICWYHSIMDWHHADYLPRRNWEDRPADRADFSRYVQYLHNQVTELLSNYGEIGVMWFDGEWESTWTHEHGTALYELCRELQPSVIVNNRVDMGRAGMAGMTIDEKYFGDFGTPEQEIPATGLPGIDWETCMTMNDHWGHNRRDHNWKSSPQLIRMLVDICSKGGNFLLNVGPKADGEIPEESIDRLRDIGRWMSVNGESIHGTRAGPFANLPWGRCTRKDTGSTTVLYLHVFDWPGDGRLLVPGLGNEVTAAHLLLQPQRALGVDRSGGDVLITVPRAAPDEICTVIALEISGRPVVYELPRILAASDIFVHPMTVKIESGSNELAVRYTTDGTDPDDHSPVYEGPFEISDRTVIRARCYHRGKPVTGVAELTLERVAPKPAAEVSDLNPGLVSDIYEGDWSALPDFDSMAPIRSEIVPRVALPAGPAVEYIGRRYRGFIVVGRDDVYIFALNSDDGSRLLIDGEAVVDNDFLHGPVEKSGRIALAKGPHPIVVEYFNKTGGAALDLRWSRPGESHSEIPPAALKHAADD